MTDRHKMKPFVLAVDFDGVIHNGELGWHDGTIYGEPMKGALGSLEDFICLGVEVIIHSTRACTRVVDNKLEAGQVIEMKKWLAKHKIPYTSIWTGPGKPLAHAYLDDRGIYFNSWAKAMAEILTLVKQLENE